MATCINLVVAVLISSTCVGDGLRVASATIPSGYVYDTQTFDQQLDHFNLADERTFKQRYLINMSYWKPNGPIFFYCGNEGDITWFCNNTGLIWDIAPQYNAMIIFAEHRYYGDSLPFGKDSYDNKTVLNYLSSEQALADFVWLIDHLKRTVSRANRSPVIAFGGSYGGMLAAWLRMKYPSAVQGALSASAPIWQFGNLTNCDAPFEIITSDFKKLTPNCAENVKKSWSAFQRVANSSGGLDWVIETFKLCTKIKAVEPLMDWLSNVYFDMAMVDYPYPASFMEPLPAWPVNVSCSKLKSPFEDDKQLLQAIFEAVNVYFNYTGVAKCLNLSSDAVSYLGERGWSYQACTEMVMPMCSNGVTDMFPFIPWNFEVFSAGCKEQWDVIPRPNQVILEYGGKNIASHSNIVFSNGDLDPWSGGGVLHSISDTLVAIVIPNGAHHLDLRAATPNDPPELVQARKIEMEHISKWIKEHYQMYKTG